MIIEKKNILRIVFFFSFVFHFKKKILFFILKKEIERLSNKLNKEGRVGNVVRLGK